MGWKKICKLLLLSFCLGLHPAGATFAADAEKVQAENNTSTRANEPLLESDWEELRQGLDYGEIEGHEEMDLDFPEAPSRWLPGKLFGTIILSIVILALLGLIIYLVVQQMDNSDERVTNDLNEFTLEDLETNLPESNLERFLRLALEQQDYRAAVRVYYLMILQKLNATQRITWEPEKTNNDYVLELVGSAEHGPFKHLTRTYEVIWYGEAPIDRERYEKVSPAYANFIATIHYGDTK